jgi:hypothetical protein
MINEQRIIEIFDSNFKCGSVEEEKNLYYWILSSIESWVSNGKVASFSPFDTIFSAQDNGVSILSIIGNGLSRQKIDKSSFSPYTLFVKSLISLLEKKNYYIDNRKAWNFVLNVVVEMKLNESINILSRLIKLEEFRLIHKEDGYDFFVESFNAVYSFGVTEDAKYFYETAINFIDKYNFLSLKLLERLLEIDAENSQKYIKNKHLKEAIKTYRYELYKARGNSINQSILLLNRYAKKYNKILVSDENFKNFFAACVENYLDFILPRSRVESLSLDVRANKRTSKRSQVYVVADTSTNMREVTQTHMVGAEQSA